MESDQFHPAFKAKKTLQNILCCMAMDDAFELRMRTSYRNY